jgi:hypothetical protein
MDELVRLTRVVFEARGISALVCAQHELRAALRHTLVSRQWSRLVEAQRNLTGSPLASRFDESLHAVLEMPELVAPEGGRRWHGLVLAIPLMISSRSEMLLALPSAMASALRASLEKQFPPGTAIRLIGRPVPQLAAHSMSAQALHDLIEELASGAPTNQAAAGPSPDRTFVAPGRSLGQHYFFALALTQRPEQLNLELPGDLQTEPRLVKWAAAQTERITSDLAERGWPLVMRICPPRRLRDMLASVPILGDVRELDGMLENAASRLDAPITALRAELALAGGGEAGIRVTLSDRSDGAPLSRALYRIGTAGAAASAYRIAVRLASAGVELAAADENLDGTVRRAKMLTSVPVPSESASSTETATPHLPRLKSLRGSFSRAVRQSS